MLFFSSAETINGQGFFNFRGKEKHRASINYPYARSYLYDAKDIVFAPAHWKEKQWTTAVVFTSATAMAMFFDKPIKEFVQRNRTHTTDNISKYGLEPWGSGKYTIGLIGVTYIGGLIFKDQYAKKVSMLAFKAGTLAFVGSLVPKYIFQRERPFEALNSDPYRFHWITGDGSHNSFISGHTIGAFAVATVYAKAYRHKKWVAPVAYSLASLVGLSRINDNAHWMSDVIGGAALGYAFGSLICSKNNWGVEISPFKSGGAIGLGINLDVDKFATKINSRTSGLASTNYLRRQNQE
jgi:membrane-associated phospholipid phosphatase